MTVAELQRRMSNAEFELWMAEYDIRGDECPYCGVEPRDMEEWEQHKVTCPVCKNDYFKTRRYNPTWQSSVHPTH